MIALRSILMFLHIWIRKPTFVQSPVVSDRELWRCYMSILPQVDPHEINRGTPLRIASHYARQLRAGLISEPVAIDRMKRSLLAWCV